jgi:hypothetical protein
VSILAELAHDQLSIQCDVCVPPMLTVGTPAHLRRTGWELRIDGAPLDVCQNCVSWVAPADRAPRRDPSPVTPDLDRLPNVVIIGAMKAGTTSMHNYLDLHPDINVSVDKEARFFQDPNLLDWVGIYQRNFTPGTPVRAESTPFYAKSPVIPGVADRMAELVPDARIIYLVRDPIDRITAEYVEQVQWSAISRPLDVELADPDEPTNSLVAGSRYATQLALYRARFGRDRVLVIDLADLSADPATVMGNVFEFVGVDRLDLDAAAFRTFNARGDKGSYPNWALRLRRAGLARGLNVLPKRLRQRLTGAAWRAVQKPVEAPEMSAETRARLQQALQPEIDALRAETGQAFASWSL